MHQSIPTAPSSPSAPPPALWADPRALTSFCLGWQIPRGGNEKRGQMPRPPSRLQHLSLIAQSSSAILSILMRDLLFQLTSSFVIVLF